MVPIELAVFDMAGTTVSEGGTVYAALGETLAAHGLQVSDEAIAAVRGTDKREALRKLIEQSGRESRFMHLLPAIYNDFTTRLVDFYRFSPAVAEMNGARETFIRLREQGIKIAINTGFSRNIAQILIDRLGWERDGLIDASVTSDEVERGRPYPFMISSLMLRLRVDNSMMVAKIGDAPADLLEGKNACVGLNVGVLFGSSTFDELKEYPHDYLIGALTDLPDIVARTRG